MRLLILIALIGMVVPVPQSSRPPSKGVVKKISPADTHPAAEAKQDQQNAENETIKAILAVVTQIQQIQTQEQNTRTAEQSEENSVEGKLVKYTRWLVIVGLIQAIALFLTVLAIKRQAKIMENQVALTQPRLHVDGVRVGWFRENQQPVFFVKIMNSGIIAAENVSIKLKVELANRVIQYKQDQVITIPANNMRECPIRSGVTIDASLLAGFENASIPLRVSGHVIWEKQTIEYCYKYYPWPNTPRPKRLRRFVPCDFDTTITTGVEIKAATSGMSVVTGNIVAKITNDPPTKAT